MVAFFSKSKNILSFEVFFMKRKLLSFAVILVVLSGAASLFAEDVENPSELSIATDFTLWPDNNPIYGETSTHFSPITGFYQALELRSIITYSYKIPVPFGTNPLVSGNNVKLVGTAEITPVSIALEPSVEFTPIAFLVFSSGFRMGTGWNFIGINGFANYDDAAGKYEPVTPFADWYLRFWMQGLFQFDLAAVLPGDWNHVVTQATYQALYTMNTDVKKGDAWCWQGSNNLVNGWEYYSSVFLGYQMPLLLQMVGVMFEFSGYYDADGIKTEYRAFKNDFMTTQISPLANIQFNEHHSLAVMFNFSNRRGFDRAANDANHETDLNLTYTSDEWFFKRVALRYSYTF